MAGRIRITQVRSTIGQKPQHVRTMRALGLRKISHSVEKESNDAILGMVRAVSHLVTYEEA